MSYSVTTYGILAIAAFVGFKFLEWIILWHKLNRWKKISKDRKKTPKDTVILHGFFDSYHVPSTSPFVLKLETYLKMANIPYKRNQDEVGPRGKMPWISINGENIPDSQLCIKFLSKKFGINLNKNYSDENLAIGTLVRIMLEEHTYWGLVRTTLVDGEGDAINSNKMKLPVPAWVARAYLKNKYKPKLTAQGMGLHTKEQLNDFVIKDLRVIATVLGNKKFLLGDEPCEDDAALFGFAAQLVYGLASDTKFAKFAQAELSNVAAYCQRMKDKFWPDWDNILAKKL